MISHVNWNTRSACENDFTCKIFTCEILTILNVKSTCGIGNSLAKSISHVKLSYVKQKLVVCEISEIKFHYEIMRFELNCNKVSFAR